MNQMIVGFSIRILLLFLVALVPRIIALGAFVTPDERRWLDRSVDMFRAFSGGDLSLAYHEGNPAGITTKWLGMAGILARYTLHRLGWRAHLDANLAASRDIWSFMDAIQQQPQNILDVLPMARLPVAVATACAIALMYVLMRRLWGERVALVGSFLIALDLFLLAHSRVLHQDALVTCFMSVSALGLALAFRYETRPASSVGVSWPMLCFSGVFAGLSALTKPSGFFLVLWTLGWTVWWAAARRFSGKTLASVVGGLTVWGCFLALTYVVLWPAMWTTPAQAFTGMLGRTSELASGGHDQFFMGAPTNDPGWAFYPVVLLFRTGPLIWLGLAVLAWAGLRRRLADLQSLAPYTNQSRAWPALFIVAFVVFVSLSAKKSDRYLLPVFPMLSILAAMGLVLFLNGLRNRDRRRAQPGRSAVSLLVAGLCTMAAIQSGIVVWHAPYYLTYYNPLVGGPLTAPHVLLVGWGEGLDQAGRYLDARPDAERLSVASFYRREFSPYFRGEVRKLSNERPDDFDLLSWHAADYVVAYISQVQREQPDEPTARYLRSLTPEHVVRLKGIAYAWIYRTPEYIPDELIAAQHVVRRTFGSHILLLGYDTPSVQPTSQSLVRLVLYWQALAHIETDYQVDLRLIDDEGKVCVEECIHPYHNQYRTSTWPKGLVIRDTHEIPLPADMPAGQYHFSLRLIDAATGTELLPTEGPVLIGPIAVGER